MFLLLPFDSLIVNLLGISLTVLFTLLLVFIIVPAIFGVSFGIRKLYMKTLLKIFAVSCASVICFLTGKGWALAERMVL